MDDESLTRLTDKGVSIDPWEACGQDSYCQRGCHSEGGCTNGCKVPKLYWRLYSYEDTGLTPEEVMNLKAAMEKIQALNLEMIAEAVHNAWWKEKIRQGKAEGHPDAISYSELSEEVKEYDRVTAREVLDTIKTCDVKVPNAKSTEKKS